MKSESTPPVLALQAAASTKLDGTIVKVFSLMELLACSEQPLGISAIADTLGLQKSNVHRLLKTLRVLGYVQQHPDTSRYSLTLKTWEFGVKVAGRSAIKRAALPFMRFLHQQHHENVHLSVLMGTDILYLESILAVFPLRATTQAGGRVPAVFPASGKALLAYRPDARAIVDEIIRTHPQAAGLSLEAIMSELDEIRRKGYATSISGWRVNVNSISAAIMAGDAPPVAAIGISGPSEKLAPEQLEALASSVMNAAAQIGEALGSGGAGSEA